MGRDLRPALRVASAGFRPVCVGRLVVARPERVRVAGALDAPGEKGRDDERAAYRRSLKDGHLLADGEDDGRHEDGGPDDRKLYPWLAREEPGGHTAIIALPQP